jgi:hypothetical protein
MISNLQVSPSKHGQGMLQCYFSESLVSLLHFVTFRTVEPSTYEFNIDLYKEVIPEVFALSNIITWHSTRSSSKESLKRLTSRSLVLTLRKKDLGIEYWPRITKEKIRNSYIKTDFSKWVDEDEQEGAKVNFDDDMDFGGMPGGMPGGLPGGFGGGGPDFDMDKVSILFDFSKHAAYWDGRWWRPWVNLAVGIWASLARLT